jgi:Family of unknown function (DUF6069)
MSMTSPRQTARLPLRIAIAGPLSIVIGAAFAIAADAAIAAVAHAAGVPVQFSPLHPASYIALTIVGVLAAGLAWSLIRARAKDPFRILTVLAPVVVAASLIPDLAVGVTKAEAATTWGGVFALMSMHLAVTAIAVTAFAILMPVRRRDTP